MAALESLDVRDLLVRYGDAAKSHRLAIDAGDHKAANRYHDAIAALYRELRQRGSAAQRELLILLRQDDPGVRAWVAAHALEFAPAEGEPVLLELSMAPGALGMSATMTLREWRAGRLRFP
jgi:hypothetical protein